MYQHGKNIINMKPIHKKNIVAIIGSASENSSNEKLIEYIKFQTQNEFNVFIYSDLKHLPHFDPELSSYNPPQEIISFRNLIENADGIIICTPEYIFSIPSGLKNALEWCVAKTVFSNKPLGIITASAQGEKGHEEIQLIMKTLMANFTSDTTLLIQGIKGKIDSKGELADELTQMNLLNFISEYKIILNV